MHRLVYLAAILTACQGSPSEPEVDAPVAEADAAAPDAPAVCGGPAVAVATTCTPPTAAAPASLQKLDYLRDRACPPQGNDACLGVQRPVTADPRPAVLVVHGGGFTGGGPFGNDILQTVARIAELGYVGISVGYRLCDRAAGTGQFPAAFSDVRCAVRYVRQHAAALGVDPTRIALLGASAGGAIVNAVGIAAEQAQLDDGTCPLSGDASVRALLSYYGGYDLTVAGDLSTGIQNTLEACKGDVALSTVSAVGYMDALDPPSLLVHGTLDNAVDIHQSELGAAALQAACVPATFVPVPGAAHAFTPLEPAVPGASAADGLTATCTAMAFLAAQLGP